jgi:hypothetical protein
MIHLLWRLTPRSADHDHDFIIAENILTKLIPDVTASCKNRQPFM